jgi:hypothetical protein
MTIEHGMDGALRRPAAAPAARGICAWPNGSFSRLRLTITLLSQGAATNDQWCADYRGEFRLGNGSWCYPLTVTDHASRFVLLCKALETTREERIGYKIYEPRHLVQEHNGLPDRALAVRNLNRRLRVRTAPK